MSNKKKIIIASIISVVIASIGIAYGAFTYSRGGTYTNKLVTGDIYMRYKETTTSINIEDMTPRSTKPSQYFEFTVEGTNTTTDKDIIYDINILHGDDYDDGDNDDTNDKVRIRDEYLRFTLEADLADGAGMHEVITNKKYSDFSEGLRIYVNQIAKNTSSKVTHTYRLYVWIDSSVVIGNANQNYTTEQWNKLFASVKVNVTGDFQDKKIPPQVGDSLSTIINSKLTTTNDVPDNYVLDGTDKYISGCREDAGCDAKNTIDFNYVWYSGKLWRIVAVYGDNTMKLVTENPVTAIYWGSNTTYNGSWVYQWLNEDFNDTLVNKDTVLASGKQWNATLTNATTKPAETTMVSGNVGLLNAYEYNNSYKKAGSKGNGYLNINQVWCLITPYSSSNVRSVSSGGDLDNFSPSSNTNAVRPSIYLSSSITFAGGDGTRNKPYQIGEDISSPTTNAKISSRVSGEYVTFKNELFRIVGKEGDTTKIVKADYIMNGSYALTKKFATSVYFGKTGNTESDTYWDYYLNNTWLPTNDTTNRGLLVEGTYYLGEYGDTGSYKNTICKISNTTETINSCVKIDDASKIYSGYVGLLRVGEMFSSQLNSYQEMWLITPYSSSNVCGVSRLGYLYYYSPSSSILGAVRPSVNLKSNIIITGGDGTEQHPFQIALGSE